MKYIYNLAFKMSISATITLLVANALSLEFTTVAAVIAILSIQDTRIKAVKMGKNRVVAGVIAVLLSAIFYKYIGQTPYIFGLFLIIFIPITSRLKVQEGMVPAVVLSTHLLIANNINIELIINELLLLLIGVGVAAVANWFMPALENRFNEDKLWIEQHYSIMMSKMAKTLITQTVDIDEGHIMKSIEDRLKSSKETAYKIHNNNLFRGSSYHIDYVDMRNNQYDMLKRMRRNFEKFNMTIEQMELMSRFTKSVSENISEENDCEELLVGLLQLKEEFKGMDLPKTREEFENRAQLLQFLNDLEEFLLIKRKFIKDLKSK